MKSVSIYLSIVLLAACASNAKVAAPTQSPVLIKKSFNEEEVRWFVTAGTGSIKGVAKFKARSGKVGYGKEFRIELMPFSTYTEERLGYLYSKKKSGHIFIQDGVPTFTPDPAAYHETRKTMCNEKGEFEFNDLPAGEYYVVAFMIWNENSADGTLVKDGGGIMQRLGLKTGEVERIEMVNF